jgi:hypothetical protein
MTPRTNRRIRLLAIAATPLVALASIGYASAAGASTDDIARLLVVVASFLITGFVAWTNRPENRMGRLMVALGLSLLVSMFAQPVWPLVVPIGLAFFVLASTLALWRGSPFATLATTARCPWRRIGSKSSIFSPSKTGPKPISRSAQVSSSSTSSSRSFVSTPAESVCGGS